MFSSSKQMYGTSSGKEGGDGTRWIVPTLLCLTRSSKSTMTLVSQNHEYNNKNIFKIPLNVAHILPLTV